MQKVDELKKQAEQKALEAGEVAAKQLSRAALSFFIGRIALTARRVPLSHKGAP